MSISDDLFLAILAMDSYNRGYGAGIADGEGAKDEDGDDIDGLGGPGSKIGTATFVFDDISSEAQTLNFYASAYEVVDGLLAEAGLERALRRLSLSPKLHLRLCERKVPLDLNLYLQYQPPAGAGVV